jgi:tetratricopeptide (TPR) repeat protein
MKRFFILLSILLITLLSNFSICNAEKIYRKDGRVVNAEILYRSKDSVWVKISSGAIGISTQDIDRIENDDGSISKHDYQSLSGTIQDFIRQQSYDEAVKLCSLLLESLPSDAQIHYLRGLLNQKIGNFEQATEDYDFLIKHGVADAEVFNNLGAIYAHNQESKEAQDFFIKAIGKNPDIVEAHNNLANLSLQIKNYTRAIEEYNKVIEKEPDNFKALYNLGIAYMNSKNYTKAKEQWEKILAIKPGDDDAKNALEYLKVKK